MKDITLIIEGREIVFYFHRNGFYSSNTKVNGTYATFTYHHKNLELYDRCYPKGLLYIMQNGRERNISNYKVKGLENDIS